MVYYQKLIYYICMEAMRGSQKSVILVARQLGVHIGPNDIPERFQIEDRELRTSEMCDLAQSFDLKAKATKISEKELIKLTSSLRDKDSISLRRYEVNVDFPDPEGADIIINLDLIYQN